MLFCFLFFIFLELFVPLPEQLKSWQDMGGITRSKDLQVRVKARPLLGPFFVHGSTRWATGAPHEKISHMDNTQPFDLCCNIYFDNFSWRTVWRMSKVTLKQPLSSVLWCPLKLCLKNDGRSGARMSWLAEECGVRDLIQCQEAVEGKWGETSVNNEVKVIWG